jgi:L-lactate dehydrogenase complex protein LldG
MRRASPELTAALADAAAFPDDPVALSRYQVGITSAERLVARTGSIFVRSDRSGGRQLSVLPPIHVVVATEAQLVFSLGDVLREFGTNAGTCSFATFITGPSRTADIEKILVLGAHGPKRLVVVMLPAG